MLKGAPEYPPTQPRLSSRQVKHKRKNLKWRNSYKILENQEIKKCNVATMQSNLYLFHVFFFKLESEKRPSLRFSQTVDIYLEAQSNSRVSWKLPPLKKQEPKCISVFSLYGTLKETNFIFEKARTKMYLSIFLKWGSFKETKFIWIQEHSGYWLISQIAI